MKSSQKKTIIFIAIFLLVAALGGLYYNYRVTQDRLAAEAVAEQQIAEKKAEELRRKAAAAKKVIPPPVVEPAFDKTRFSVDDPASIWVVVNKRRPLNPKEHIPTDLVIPAIPLRYTNGAAEMKLRSEAARALETMVAAAKLDKANLMIASGYRSYTTQVAVYGNEVSRYGQATADTQSARPGFSEHQTGLGVDLEPTSRQCEIEDCFADTVEGKWLAANAPRFGFIQRYTAGKPAITGYRAESWHYRYIGIELAAEMAKQGITTLEEFFALPAAPSYE